MLKLARVYNSAIGSVGVEMFIFLSGIGLYFSLQKNPDIAQFYERRIKRIVLPYLIVALIYWLLEDFWVKKAGIMEVVCDFSFITFFTRGVRTFWYVLFISLAYALYPLIYKLLHTKLKGMAKLWILIALAVIIQSVPRLITPDLYNNVEIMLCRFLVFFIGAYCGQRVFNKAPITKADVLFFNFGVVLMILYRINFFRPLLDRISFRNILCFWGISLLFYIVFAFEMVSMENVRKALSIIGKYSFELYLTHVAIRAYMNSIGVLKSNIWYYLICILASCILAVLLYKIRRRIFG